MCNVGFVTAVASLTKKMWEVVVFLEVELRILPARRLDPGKFRGLGNGGNSTIAQNLLVFIPTSSLVHLLLVLIPFSPNLGYFLDQGANVSGKRPGQGVLRSRRRDDNIDVEDFPDPPHISQSYKWLRTSSGLRTVQIQYDGSRVVIRTPPMLKLPYVNNRIHHHVQITIVPSTIVSPTPQMIITSRTPIFFERRRNLATQPSS